MTISILSAPIKRVAVLVALLLGCVGASAGQLMITEASRLSFDIDTRGERIVLSILDQLWLLPASGGVAEPVTPEGLHLRNPRLSPDGRSVVAEGGWDHERQHLWQISLVDREVQRLTRGAWRDHSASWHPDGQRLLFVSDRGGSDDIWELDLSSGTARRLTSAPGREFDPTFSSSGAQILYIAQDGDEYRLQRRYYAGQPHILVRSERPISAPAVRSDGVLITYLTHTEDSQPILQMLLPVREMVTKPLLSAQGIERQPIRWLDRTRFIIAIDGRLEIHELAGERLGEVPFTAWVSVATADPPSTHTLPTNDNAGARIVLRAARIANVETQQYLQATDVLIEDGVIAAVTAERAWPNTQILDLGDTTIVPGLIDLAAYDTGKQQAGNEMLAAGITTTTSLRVGNPAIIEPGSLGPRRLPTPVLQDISGMRDSRERLAEIDAARGRGERILTDQLVPDAIHGVHLISNEAISSVLTDRDTRSDVRDLLSKSGAFVLSDFAQSRGLAAPELELLKRSRLYRGMRTAPPGRAPAHGRAPAYPHLLVAYAAGSRANAPLGLHAELLAMRSASVSPGDILASATWRAADIAGRSDLGRIKVGATADLLIVSGDPLSDSRALLDTVGVVFAGQFLSVASLLERNDPP